MLPTEAGSNDLEEGAHSWNSLPKGSIQQACSQGHFLKTPLKSAMREGVGSPATKMLAIGIGSSHSSNVPTLFSRGFLQSSNYFPLRIGASMLVLFDICKKELWPHFKSPPTLFWRPIELILVVACLKSEVYLESHIWRCFNWFTKWSLLHFILVRALGKVLLMDVLYGCFMMKVPSK